MFCFRSAVLNAGYRVSLSHTNSRSLKTDAPSDVVWDIMRCHVARGGPRPEDKPLPKDSAAYKILSKQPSIKACFDIRDDANPPSRSEGLLRFQINPEKYWGPGSRARTR